MTEADIAIIGAGIAGAGCALRLARAGREVVLLERASGPANKVCGEFIAGPALSELDALDIAPRDHGAVPIHAVKLSAERASDPISLPFTAVSLTRKSLDSAVLEAAQHAGAEFRFNARVTQLEKCAAGWRLTVNGEAMTARTVIVASGKHELRGHERNAAKTHTLVGLKRYIERPSNLGQVTEIALFPNGYCGIQPVEGGRANLCLVLTADELRRRGGEPLAILNDVANRAGYAPAPGEDGDSVFAIGRVPYGYVRTGTDGPYYVGDQAAVIPSFCGEGIGLALRSARAISDAILSGTPADNAQAAFARHAGPRVRAATLLSRSLCDQRLQGLAVRFAQHAPRAVQFLAARTRTRPVEHSALK